MERKSQQNINTLIFDNTSSWGLLWKMSIPSVVTTLIMLIYNMADVFFVGQMDDSMQVAAVSLCAPVFSMLSALGMLFGIGGSIRCATLYGEGKREQIRSISAFCFWGAILTGILISCGILLAKIPFLKLLGASEQTLEYADGYLSIMVSGAPLMMFCQSFSSLLRADGQVKDSMYGSIIGSLTNIVLDPIFILAFGWGVRGAAIATVLANVVNGVYLLLIIKNRPDFSINPKHICFQWSKTGAVLLLGFPMVISTLLNGFSGVMSNNILAGYGDVFLAANGVTSKLRLIVSMVVMGICMGIQPAISYYYGARDHKKMSNLIKSTAMTTIIIGSCISILCILMKDSVIAVFIDDKSVIQYGRQMVVGGMVSGPIQGIFQLCTSFLQGTGNVLLATGMAICRQVVFIPILILSNMLFGFDGLVFASSIATFVCTIIGVSACFLWFRKLRALRARTSETLYQNSYDITIKSSQITDQITKL